MAIQWQVYGSADGAIKVSKKLPSHRLVTFPAHRLEKKQFSAEKRFSKYFNRNKLQKNA